MNGDLKHIFDESVCLSSRQLKDYVSGHMANEECHAVEHHLNGCPLCSAAVDGMLLEPERSLATMAEMNTDFLKEQFNLKNPQVQLNSIAQQDTPIMETPKPGAKMKPFWRTVAAAAAVFGTICIFWYVRSSQRSDQNAFIAQKFDEEKTPKTSSPKQEVQQVQPAQTAGNADVATEETSAAPPETQTTTVDNNAAAGVATAGVQAKPAEAKPANIPAVDAKKAADDKAKAAQLLADNKKSLAEKAKAVPDAKKIDPNAGKQPAGNVAKLAAKDEHHVLPEKPAAVAKQDNSRNKAAEPAQVHTMAAAAPPPAPAPAHIESTAATAGTEAKSAKTSDDLPADKMDRAKYYFKKEKWADALKEYKTEINNSSKSKRHEASYMAAQCYIKLGNSKEAQRLLKIVVDEGGPDKRHAKKLLESIEKQ
jgi:hypothetical protein